MSKMSPGSGLVDIYLKASRKDKKRPAGILYVTDLTKNCLRNAYWGIVDRKPYDLSTLKIFEMGNVLEDWWVEVLEAVPGISVLTTQLPCYFKEDGWSIHGRLDVLCQHGERLLIGHEVKTIKNFRYLEKPKENHVAQLNFYLISTGLSKGFIDYISKETMLQGGEEADRYFEVLPDYQLFADTVARARNLLHAWRNNLVPKITQGWQCDYCQWKSKCEELEGGS